MSEREGQWEHHKSRPEVAVTSLLGTLTRQAGYSQSGEAELRLVGKFKEGKKAGKKGSATIKRK
jgi:hypothetical protein